MDDNLNFALFRVRHKCILIFLLELDLGCVVFNYLFNIYELQSGTEPAISHENKTMPVR